jgi:hypothetical protein
MECSINMTMQHGHGIQYGHEHAAWTWTCSMDMDMDMQHGQGQAALILRHGPGQWTCMDAWMSECWKKAQSGIISFPLVCNA